MKNNNMNYYSPLPSPDFAPNGKEKLKNITSTMLSKYKYSYIYIWLKKQPEQNKEEKFWFYITNIFKDSICGYEWEPSGFKYRKVLFKDIDSYY